MQAHVRALHKTVWAAAGGDTDRVREFFGFVMLLNAVAAIDVPELLGPDWYRRRPRPDQARVRSRGGGGVPACSAIVWRRSTSMPIPPSTTMARTENGFSKTGSGPQTTSRNRIDGRDPERIAAGCVSQGASRRRDRR